MAEEKKFVILEHPGKPDCITVVSLKSLGVGDTEENPTKRLNALWPKLQVKEVTSPISEDRAESILCPVCNHTARLY